MPRVLQCLVGSVKLYDFRVLQMILLVENFLSVASTSPAVLVAGYLGLCIGLALICALVPGQKGADLQGPVRGVRGVQEGEAGGGGEEGGAGREDGEVGGGEGGAGQPHPGQ